jgi:serine protease Do
MSHHRLGAAIVLAALLTAGCQLGYPPHRLSEREVTEDTRAATVLVQSDFDVTVSTPDPAPNQGALDRLVAQVQGMIDQGRFRSLAAAEAYYQDQVLTNPGRYLEVGGTRTTDDYTFIASGSGFFINSTGYLVTAAHVVAPTNDSVHQTILDSLDDSFLKSVTDEARTDLNSKGSTATEAQVAAFASWAANYYRANFRVDTVKGTFHVTPGEDVEVGDPLPGGALSAQLVAAGSPAPGKDLAVLRVSDGHYPSLALGDENQLNVKSRMTEVGYPCHCDLKKLSASLTLGLTATTGVPGPSVDQDGWTAISTTAEGTHGDSGGPVVGPDGRVVGAVSFGYGNSGDTFLLPVSVVKAFAAQNGVKADPGPVSRLYWEAQADYEQHRYRLALPLFQQVASLDPAMPFSQHFIDLSRQAIRKGRDQTPPDLSPFLFPASALVLFLAVGLFAVLMLRWGERRSRP